MAHAAFRSMLSLTQSSVSQVYAAVWESLSDLGASAKERMESSVRSHALLLAAPLPLLLSPALFPCRQPCLTLFLHSHTTGCSRSTPPPSDKARDTRTDEIIAVKRVKMQGERGGLPQSTLREIAALKQLDHENVVR